MSLKTPLLFLSFSLVVSAFGQNLPGVTQYSKTINFNQANDTARLQMGGFLDGNNTFTYPITRAFQPMKRITISNTGNEIVNRPRVLINSERNWFDINGVREDCFAGVVTPKDRALSVWQFVKNNRIHFYEPDQGKEIDDPIKLLGVYGYGVCYNASGASSFINSLYPYTQIPYKEFSPRNRHSVKDYLFGDTFMLIDPDIETFYLNYDNKSISDYNTIANDKHLIRRVHHYGKATSFNAYNNFVSNFVYEPTTPNGFSGIYRDVDFHMLDFILRPGESVIYNWEPAKYYHYNFIYEPIAPLNEAGNGQLNFSTNFNNVDLNKIITSAVGVTRFSVDSLKPNIHPAQPEQSSSFVIKVTSPFVIVNATLFGNFYREHADDQVEVYFSKDSLMWQPVWKSMQIGSHSDSVNLYSQIQPVGTAATYNYYLRFEMRSIVDGAPCGIDSLRIRSDFQVSKYFLPALRLGENLVSYSDASTERNIEIKIEWQESSENSPPQSVTTPIFPANEAIVDSLKFTFSWETAIDEDGIIDYEFMLSDRPDVKYPLSPTFEIYTSMISSSQGLASFPIPFDGLLNANTTYYWKVRAKDARGAWSDWSSIWSFTPKGTMPPIAKQATVKANNLMLSWIKNTEGSAPNYYEIHASNEAFGFSPNQSTLLDTAKSESKKIPITTTPKTFYRIIAIDANGSKSGPSNFISIPYPSVIQKDSINSKDAFTISLNAAKASISDVVMTVSVPFVNVDIDDEIGVNIISKPDWMTYDRFTQNLTGIPSGSEALKDSVVVEFVGHRTGYRNIQTFKMIPKGVGVASISSDAQICPGEDAYLTISYSGFFPWKFELTDGTDTTSVSDIKNKEYFLKVNPLVTTKYRLLNVEDQLASFISIKNSLARVTVLPFSLESDSYKALSGVSFREQVPVNNPCNFPLHYEITSGPLWLAVDKSKGILTGVPGDKDVGAHSFTITVSDSVGTTATESLSVNVKNLSHLVKAHVKDTLICWGDKVNVELKYWGPLPWGFSISDVNVNNIESRSYNVLVSPNSQGIIHFNSISFASKTYAVDNNIDKVQFHAPLIKDLEQKTTYAGLDFSAQVSLASGCDKEVMYTLLKGPSWMKLNPHTGLINGVPKNKDIGLSLVQIKAIDKLGRSNVRTDTILVIDRNDLPGIISVSPNPFVAETKVLFILNKLSTIRLEVFTTNSQKIEDIVLTQKPAGIHEINLNALNYSSGLYHIVMTVTEDTGDSKIFSRKIIKK